MEQRFAGTGVRDQIAGLCVDGTARLATSVVPTIKTQLESGGPIARAAVDDPQAFLGLSEVITPASSGSARFRETFVAAYRRLAETGPLDAIRAADDLDRT